MNKEVYHEGWLIKSPPTKRIWRARWRRRWFTLKQGEIPGQFCLEYYTDRNCRKLKGVIDLDQCEQVDSGLRLEHRKQKFQYMFDIKTPRRTYYLAADTENDMRDWVNCICQVCNLHDFTKQSGERQYYNLCENDAPLAVPEVTALPPTSCPDMGNANVSLPDLLTDHTSMMSISDSHHNNDSSYVNTEFSNRETMINTSGIQVLPQTMQNLDNRCITEQNANAKNLERSHSFKMNSSTTEIMPQHIRAQSLSEQSSNSKNGANIQSKTGIKKIPENLVLSDKFVESNVEPSPALSTSSGPYIPISECFSGSPKYLTDENPTTPLNNLDPKFYDTPRSHNNIGLNLTNDQSYSPKIYNCPQGRPRSGRSSPADSDDVFSEDEERSYQVQIRDPQDRNLRPSDSSAENEDFIFTYTQRFSKIPDDKPGDSKKIMKKKGQQLHLDSASEDDKNRDTDTDNASPAIGPKDANSCVDEKYDIPRSHNFPYYNINSINNNSISPIIHKDTIASSTPNLLETNEGAVRIDSCKTLPRSHFYTNAAPAKLEGNVFRYDFVEQSDAPAVNRSLKPKLHYDEKSTDTLGRSSTQSTLRGAVEKTPKPPSIDRKLKPFNVKGAIDSPTTNIRPAPLSCILPGDTDYSVDPRSIDSHTLPRASSASTSYINHPSSVQNNTPNSSISNSALQYFDLDVSNPPPPINRTVPNFYSESPSPHRPKLVDEVTGRAPAESSVVYKSVDFLKTEAFKRIREDAEKNRMKDE